MFIETPKALDRRCKYGHRKNSKRCRKTPHHRRRRRR